MAQIREVHTGLAARHRLKRGHAVVADSGNHAREWLAAGVVLRGAQQPQATAPGGKGESGLRSEQTCQCATADPDGVCPSVGVEASTGILDQAQRQDPQSAVRGERQCELCGRGAANLVEDQGSEMAAAARHVIGRRFRRQGNERLL